MEAAWLQRLLGRRLRVTLACGSYAGFLRHVDPGTKAIALDLIEDLENNRKLPGVKMFFGHEIKNLEFLDAVSCETVNKPRHADKNNLENVTTKPPEVPFGWQESSEEETDLMFLVIDQFHQKFGPAILHIKQQSVIGVAVEGVDVCRFGKLCWLQIATKSQIYLFDISLLGAVAFKNGLAMILTDSNILKVIHDCRLVSDCLYHQYGVDLTNVFDTQVADVLQFSLETGGLLPSCVSTFEESLVCHLSLLPPKVSFLQYRAQMVKVNPRVWASRPLSPCLLRIAALEVRYLLPLRSILMDKLMLDFTTQVDNYLNMYRNMPSFTLGCPENFFLELPYELKEMQLIRRLRREDAWKEYAKDDSGRLVRPYPGHVNAPKSEGRVVAMDEMPKWKAAEPPTGDSGDPQRERLPLLEPSAEPPCPPLEDAGLSD
ncbi:piRNA biogenesis protein EXD1 isoform X1 [Callorhinchus milii]|nr:piRNA biogenesis protein EXD1 isoform X1 [Callorhinchus milii]|eukprot:gi/632983852/ref/XP_007908852.1/ PREDICTED: exonuclease 3'-5' domain-containing protein 1 isoform X1 [Callorhinchus milii]